MDGGRYWTYRVVRHPSGHLHIHEVYYNAAGKAWAYTLEPVEPWGDTPEELAEDTRLQRLAWNAPVLDLVELAREASEYQ
jgi:hypothetical protein